MKYIDNLEKAANHLRLAVPMMVKYAIPPNPHNYAIWYHYVAGLDPELRKALDNRLSQHQGIDSSDTESIYNTYIAPVSEAERTLQESLFRLIEQVSGSVESTCSETSLLNSTLTRKANELDHAGSQGVDEKQLRLIFDELSNNLQAFSRCTTQFQSQLDDAKNEITQLRQALEQSQWEASHDTLTGLYNRAAFQQHIDYMHRNSDSTHLILMDIDHFKKINDSFGHNAGDNVLQAVGKLLSSQQPAYCARYGGEEFAILLDNKSAQQASDFAEKLRIALSQKKLRYNGNPAHITSVTASFGIAHLHAGAGVSECIEHADQALYQAKRSGRNCVVSYETDDFSD